MVSAERLVITIPSDYAGQRLDVALTQLISKLSRSEVTHLIHNKKVNLKNYDTKPSYRLKGGESVEIFLEVYPEPFIIEPSPIKLDILYEDEDIIVLNKAAGMVVHPAPGNYKDTLVNALVYRFPQIHTVGATDRPGIVHRLDKDTSGVMVVARNKDALNHLASQFKSRSLEKKYLTLVWGVPKANSGKITYPIGRHPTDRKKMSIISRRGRNAETIWCIREHYTSISFLKVTLKTGRTHQIRVHLAAANHPIIGDPLYGRKNIRLAQGMSHNLLNKILKIQRQMLHAWQLKLIHPRTQIPLSFKAPLPCDMQVIIKALKTHSIKTHGHY
jgi:23S rRNA pseudouridine1911/1915/1917 synthase